MKLVLTGLGNEVDLNTGKTIFTAVFNRGIRIEISKEAAEVLTKEIYGRAEAEPVPEEPTSEGDIFGGDLVTGAPTLEDTPSSVYDDDTGVEQV